MLTASYDSASRATAKEGAKLRHQVATLEAYAAALTRHNEEVQATALAGMNHLRNTLAEQEQRVTCLDASQTRLRARRQLVVARAWHRWRPSLAS